MAENRISRKSLRGSHPYRISTVLMQHKGADGKVHLWPCVKQTLVGFNRDKDQNYLIKFGRSI